MNCDLAFDYLTDKTLADAPELVAHLEHCPRCRELRGVLSPAMAWLQDTPAEAGHSWEGSFRGCEDSALPSPFLSSATLALAEEAATKLGVQVYSQLAVTAQSRRARKSWWRVGISSSALILAVAAGWLMGQNSPVSLVDASAPATTCLWKSPSMAKRMEDQSPRAIAMSCLACHWTP